MLRSKHALMRLSRVSLVLGGLALLVLLGTQAVRTSAATPAYIRVIHASPAVGTADVFVDGNPLLSSFAFGSVTDYVPLPAGPHKVQIALVGKGIGASVITQTLAVQPGTVYTAAAIGSQATGLSIEVFIDNNFLAAGQAKTRIYNLSPDAGSFNVSANGSNILSQIGYKQASDYMTMTAGSYNFALAALGSNINLPLAMTLDKNTITSIFAVGMANGTPKIELVPSQVSGVPGVPSTGSDPRPLALPDNVQSQGLTPWLLSILASVFIGASILFRRRAKIAG
ncbi:MAG TPA: DUF4397 domain-containing protein [Ktedonobacteraceae bacterium]|nr:DUF4397 domain-containing protein [Ktedonobacteraceae bacterium]